MAKKVQPAPGERVLEDEIKSAYYNQHDLREMYSRENTERRRQSGHTFRKYLTTKQDKQCLNRFVKIRDAYEVTNNNDVVIVFVQQLIDEGKADDIDPALLELVKDCEIKKREGPFEPEG